MCKERTRRAFLRTPQSAVGRARACVTATLEFCLVLSHTRRFDEAHDSDPGGRGGPAGFQDFRWPTFVSASHLRHVWSAGPQNNQKPFRSFSLWCIFTGWLNILNTRILHTAYKKIPYLSNWVKNLKFMLTFGCCWPKFQVFLQLHKRQIPDVLDKM